MTLPQFDPALDLVLERVIDVPRDLVWRSWTEPERLKRWFCPRPWSVSDCEIDLRPGGRFNTVMRSPEGQDCPNQGCYLEVVPQERLAWTDALSAGYRPSARGYLTGDGGFYVSCFLALEALGSRTRYSAYAFHSDGAGRRKHLDMGFQQGWSTALDQLVDLCGNERGSTSPA